MADELKAPLFPKNIPIDETRISFIETIITRLIRRAKKTTRALVTPYPISNAVFGDKVEGAILRYMFPCDGVISKGFIKLGVKPKTTIILDMKIFNSTSSNTKGFVLYKIAEAVDINIPVKAGDCMEIVLHPEPAEIVTEVWLSFLWKPTTSDVETKSFLISELENDIL